MGPPVDRGIAAGAGRTLFTLTMLTGSPGHVGNSQLRAVFNVRCASVRMWDCAYCLFLVPCLATAAHSAGALHKGALFTHFLALIGVTQCAEKGRVFLLFAAAAPCYSFSSGTFLPPDRPLFQAQSTRRAHA